MAKFKRRWMKIGTGAAAGVTTLALFFAFLISQYGFEFVDYSADLNCVGSTNFFCASHFGINNPSDKNVDIYSSDNLKMDFDDSGCLKDYALFTRDGRCSSKGVCRCELKNGQKIGFDGWRCVDFTNKTKPRKDVKYVFRFPAYTEKEFLLVGWKTNRTCEVKWGFPVGKGSFGGVWGSYPEEQALADYLKAVYNITVVDPVVYNKTSPTHVMVKFKNENGELVTILMAKTKYDFVTLNEVD